MRAKLKKIIKSIAIVMVSLIILPFLAYGIFCLAVPISRPSNAVRSYVLRKMPIGTDWNDVIKTAEEQNWKVYAEFTDRGLTVSKITGNIRYEEEDDKDNSNLDVMGEQLMHVILGKYRFIGYCGVSVYLVFDENSKLIEAYISKDWDSI